jgi:hypothetical protein
MKNTDIINKIYSGKLLEAYALMQEFENNYDDFTGLIFEYAFRDTNIMIYEFLIYVYNRDKSIDVLKTIVEILYQTYCCYEGGYSLSLYYHRKVLEIEPEKIENWIHLLSYNDIPERLLSDDEVKLCLRKIGDNKI